MTVEVGPTETKHSEAFQRAKKKPAQKRVEQGSTSRASQERTNAYVTVRPGLAVNAAPRSFSAGVAGDDSAAKAYPLLCVEDSILAWGYGSLFFVKV